VERTATRSLLAALACAGLAWPAAASDSPTEAMLRRRDYPAVHALAAARLARDPDDAEALHDEGLVALEWDREPERAVALLERAVALEPNVARFRVGLGGALGLLVLRSGPLSAARAGLRSGDELRKAVALDPLSVRARAGLCLYYILSPALAGGSLRRAREQALAAQQVDRSVGAFLLGRVVEAEGDDEAAERWWREAVATAADPLDAAEAYNRLGLLFSRRGRHAEAEAALERARGLVPLEPNLHDSLGEVLLAKGDPAAAARAYQDALRVNPRFESAQRGLRVAREKAARLRPGQ
jgi:tetratricopeptide (TPR) repeat protein